MTLLIVSIVLIAFWLYFQYLRHEKKRKVVAANKPPVKVESVFEKIHKSEKPTTKHAAVENINKVENNQIVTNYELKIVHDHGNLLEKYRKMKAGSAHHGEKKDGDHAHHNDHHDSHHNNHDAHHDSHHNDHHSDHHEEHHEEEEHHPKFDLKHAIVATEILNRKKSSH